MLTSGIVLIHHNACSQSAAATQQILPQLQWDIFYHQPCLALRDFHFFLEFKKWIGRWRFETIEELQLDTIAYLSLLAVIFYEDDILRFAPV